MSVGRAQGRDLVKAAGRTRRTGWGGKCLWCGMAMLRPVTRAEAEDDAAATREHLVPLSRGGSRHQARNLAEAHRWCNIKRGNRMDWIPRAWWAPTNRPHESQLSAVARFGVTWPW